MEPLIWRRAVWCDDCENPGELLRGNGSLELVGQVKDGARPGGLEAIEKGGFASEKRGGGGLLDVGVEHDVEFGVQEAKNTRKYVFARFGKQGTAEKRKNEYEAAQGRC